MTILFYQIQYLRDKKPIILCVVFVLHIGHWLSISNISKDEFFMRGENIIGRFEYFE